MDALIFLGVCVFGVFVIISAISEVIYSASGRRDVDEYLSSDKYKEVKKKYGIDDDDD